jgi:hypothetical protein
MSSIPPSLPPSAPLPPALPAATVATVLADATGQLSGLPLNSLVEATLAKAATSQNVVELITPAGPVVVKLALQLPVAAQLQLQLIAAGSTPQLRVVSVNGQTVSPGGQIAPEPAAGPSRAAAAPEAAGTTTAVTRSAGAAGITATVLRGPAGPGPAPPALPAGTSFTVRIASVTPPAQPSMPASDPAPGTPLPGADVPAAAPPADLVALSLPGIPVDRPEASFAASALARLVYGASEPFPPSAAAPPDAASVLPDKAVPPGQLRSDPATAEMAVAPPEADVPPAVDQPPAEADQLVADEPSAAPAPAPMPTAKAVQVQASAPSGEPPSADELSAAPPAMLPRTLTGTVAPNSLAGQPLVQTAAGLLALDTALDLPPGAQLELVPIGPPAHPAAGAVQDPSAPEAGADRWLALDAAIRVLQQTAPQAAQELVRQLPDLGLRLAPNLIAFVSAVQTGAIESWLGGGPVKALERAGRRDLVDSLVRDVGEMRTPVQLPIGGDWQTIVVPLFFGQQIERIRLIMRRPPDSDDEAEAREEEGARFLVDVEMSRLGPLQLDGLVKRRAKRFDLILRSRYPLPDDVRRGIVGIFSRCLDGLGMIGSASFQQAVAFVVPIPLRRRSPGVTI